MKYVIAIVLLATGLGYFSKEAWNKFSDKKAEKVQSEMEKSLFPFIVQAQPKEAIFARPMQVEETSNTLTVYCEYFGDKDIEVRENLRKQLSADVKKWSETQPKKYQYIFIKFTDEMINPFPPQQN